MYKAKMIYILLFFVFFLYVALCFLKAKLPPLAAIPKTIAKVFQCGVMFIITQRQEIFRLLLLLIEIFYYIYDKIDTLG
jgi:hypothetical protein